jgi:hypothetical protein
MSFYDFPQTILLQRQTARQQNHYTYASIEQAARNASTYPFHHG